MRSDASPANESTSPILARDADTLSSDEVLLTLPTDAWLSPDGRTWMLPVHAWVYEPESDSMLRNMLINGFGKAIGLDDDGRNDPLFRTRAGMFFIDNEGGKRLVARLTPDEPARTLPATASNGHVDATVEIDAASLSGDSAKIAARVSAGWLSVTVAPAAGGRSTDASVRLVPSVGVSVISDIDDTIKISNARDKSELLKNSFVGPYRSVDGMAAVYRAWSDRGAIFHYVTSSPWQLHRSLSDWLAHDGFPRGTMRMKYLSGKRQAFVDLFEASDGTKQSVLDELLTRYPLRQVVLVGDSGQDDPAIYASVARRFPAQVLHIFIRNVTEESPAAPRWSTTFQGLDAGRWTVFEDPAALTRFKLPLPPPTATSK
ncbi:MAG: phosphatase domain-containing protein [Phycisphaerae bacterium]|nr:phosphatase domain-containing protein [Phycisphaerae bacterium]